MTNTWVNANTYADDTGNGAVIRADVLISADSQHDIDSYRLGAQEAFGSQALMRD